MKLNQYEAYRAMMVFLEGYYRQTRSNDIKLLLEDMMLRGDGTTADPVAWETWLEAVAKGRDRIPSLGLQPSEHEDHICPVCGYDDLLRPPYDVRGNGSGEVCPCCFFQFGNDDVPDKAMRMAEWRQRWIERGCPWRSNNCPPPDGWSAALQLDQIG